jgi:hypothetical protein
MSTPEILPEQPQQMEVTHVVEKYDIPETQQQLGITTPPVAPEPVVADNKVIAQPVVTHPADPTVFQVPADTGAHNISELQKLAKGDATLSKTWYDAQWLREIKKKIKLGFTAIFS